MASWAEEEEEGQGKGKDRGEEKQFIRILISLIENLPNSYIISCMRFQFGFKTKSRAAAPPYRKERSEGKEKSGLLLSRNLHSDKQWKMDAWILDVYIIFIELININVTIFNVNSDNGIIVWWSALF